jgi:hypothetical protein
MPTINGRLPGREESMRLLVTVKAYPQPSKRYGETVCVAGVRIDTDIPSWVRLYPVAYRDLDVADQFRKYQIVNLRAFRNVGDHRPESYKPNIPSVKLGEVLPSTPGWQRRWKHLDPLAGQVTACGLLAQQGSDGAASLGMVKPRVITRVEVTLNPDFDEDRKRVAEIAAREHLFSTDARAALEPAPYKVTYYYRCANLGCAGHAQGVIDWEAGAAARRWRMKGYPEDELPDRLRNKFFTQMCASDRDTYFFLGNQQKRPRVFMVLGVFWPPAGSRPDPKLF